jgi:hypothetical protein
MNLLELQGNKKTLTQRALREHYETNVDLSKLGTKKTVALLSKVRGLLKESQQAGQSQIQNNRGYLKLVMMEQMLSAHYRDLKAASRLVLENEEVQKSQVILAAQDMKRDGWWWHAPEITNKSIRRSILKETLFR